MPPAGSKVKHCQCVFASESPIERKLSKIPKHGSTEAAHWPHDYKIVVAFYFDDVSIFMMFL